MMSTTTRLKAKGVVPEATGSMHARAQLLQQLVRGQLSTAALLPSNESGLSTKLNCDEKHTEQSQANVQDEYELLQPMFPAAELTSLLMRHDDQARRLYELMLQPGLAREGASVPEQDEKVYCALSQDGQPIRLLVLMPASTHEDPIRCALAYADMVSGVEYEALSYTWGDTTVTAQIVLDKKPFSVTTNLKAALQALRPMKPNLPRVLWVDAICINQADSLERTRQVSLMGEIYAKAQQVIAWLGPETNTAATFWTLIHDFEAYFKDAVARGIVGEFGAYREGVSLKRYLEQVDAMYVPLMPLFFQQDRSGQSYWKSRGEPKLRKWTESTMRAGLDILALPWFSRIWTVQEAALSRKLTFHCGRLQPVSEYMFEQCVQMLQSIKSLDLKSPPTDSHTKSTIEISRILITAYTHLAIKIDTRKVDLLGTPLSFRKVLISCIESMQCSDPRDIIYGLLEIAKKIDPTCPAIIPDYNMTVEELYIRTARGFVETGRDLEVIALARNHLQCQKKLLRLLPSWVPDWSDGTRSAKDLAWAKSFDGLFSAGVSNFGCAKPSFDIFGRLLTVSGAIIDYVDIEGPAGLRNGMRSVSDIRLCRRHLQVSSWGESKITQEDEEFWRSFFCDTGAPKDLVGKSYEQVLDQSWGKSCAQLLDKSWDFSLFFNRLETEIDDVSHIPPRTLEEEQSLMRRALKEDRHFGSVHMTNFMIRMFRTKSGRFMRGPRDVRVGDTIAVLCGLSTPVVLRKASGLWTLVGICYVHGVMDGEALRDYPIERISIA